MADAPDSKSGLGQPRWGFKSPLRHHSSYAGLGTLGPRWDRLPPTVYRARMLPCGPSTPSAPTMINFRGSITRPDHSLSTLRSAGRPAATQDSLPAAGLLCRAGFHTCRVPTKGFSVLSHSLPPFPSFPGAKMGFFGGTALARTALVLHLLTLGNRMTALPAALCILVM